MNLNFYIFGIFIIPLFMLVSFKLSKFFKIYDYPDQKRKIHLRPIPLVGGIFFTMIMLFIFICSVLLLNNDSNLTINNFNNNLIILISLSLVFIVGLYDDLKNIGALIKLSVIFLILFITFNFIDDSYVVSDLVFFNNFYISTSYYAPLVTAILLLFLINAFNMIDGIDCLASIISLIWIALLNLFIPFNDFYFFTNIILICSLILFIYLNFNKKCFLGDGGSFILSLYVSFLTIYTYNSNINLETNYLLNVESIFLLFLIPGVDMFRLFLVRIKKKKNPFKADSDHLHHHLLNNFGNSFTLIIYSALVFIPWFVYYFYNFVLPYLIVSMIAIYYYLLINYNKNEKKN
tara:strand:+ start:3103 stop:4146 length:1044 start_codon:yes stop_codon:yes gene_type:complete